MVLRKGKNKIYYDFGDDWEHTILVEKVLDYDKRYPQVLKYKGPNMIEDCGGIWGFYDVIEEAEPFDIEESNTYLKEHMEFPVFESSKEEENYDPETDIQWQRAMAELKGNSVNRRKRKSFL